VSETVNEVLLNGVLLEAFRHDAWATKEVLAFCRDLSEDQLEASVQGSYGDIMGTFNHLIRAHAGYLRAPAGTTPDWALQRVESNDFDELLARVEGTARLWEEFLSDPVDSERILTVDEGKYEVRLGVIVAQALHHGNAHREQINSILTSLGLEPPDLQVWAYAEATGRIWERTAR
jgi:uncharacterized damage-inducible protein DinB